MEPMYYIGLDVHKRKISYCVKESCGKVLAEGLLPATRLTAFPKGRATCPVTAFTRTVNAK